MTNAGRGYGLRGKGKTAEDEKFPQNFSIWAQTEHVCDCRGYLPRCAIEYL